MNELKKDFHEVRNNYRVIFYVLTVGSFIVGTLFGLVF